MDDLHPLHGDKHGTTPPACAKQQQPIGSMNTGTISPLHSEEASAQDKTEGGAPKPRIWSLADVATSGQATIKDPSSTGTYSHTIQHRPLLSTGAGAADPLLLMGQHKDLYSGHLAQMSGFRPWVNGSMYAPSQSVGHPMYHSPSGGGIMGLPPTSSSSGPLGSSPLSSSSPPSGLTSSAAGLLRPYPLSARAEVH